jgi:hypothetical protein
MAHPAALTAALRARLMRTRPARHRARPGPAPWIVVLAALVVGVVAMRLAIAQVAGSPAWIVTSLVALPLASYGVTATMVRLTDRIDGPRAGGRR